MKFGLVIRIPKIMIRISIPKSVFGSKEMKFGLVIWISIPESVSECEEMKFGLVIRIPEIVIRISIPKIFLNSEKVKFGLVIRITKEAIRILSVKAIDKSWICTSTKMGIFLYVFDIFWIWLFMTKINIRSKYF